MPKTTHCFRGHPREEYTGKNGRCKLCMKLWREKSKPEGIGNLCECGCGKLAGVYLQSHPAKGQIKGQPKRFLPGHGGHGSLAERASKTHCKNGHPISASSLYANGACKQCVSEKAQVRRGNKTPEQKKKEVEATLKWKKKHPESVRRSHHRGRYNLPPEVFDKMLFEQEGKCFICSVLFDYLTVDTTPYVDHDHNCCSGKRSCGICVRGLICRGCNIMLGAARDNITTLRNATQYLETQKCKVTQNLFSELRATAHTRMGLENPSSPESRCSAMAATV